MRRGDWALWWGGGDALFGCIWERIIKKLPLWRIEGACVLY